MEQWEIDLRAKLQKELVDGLFQVGTPGGIHLWTGKGGAIEIEVALQKEIRKYKPVPTKSSGLKNYNPKYKKLTEDELRARIEDFFYGVMNNKPK